MNKVFMIASILFCDFSFADNFTPDPKMPKADACKASIEKQLHEFGVKVKHVKDDSYSTARDLIRQHQDNYDDARNRLKVINANRNPTTDNTEETALIEKMRKAEIGFKAEVARFCKKDAFFCKRIEKTQVGESLSIFAVEKWADTDRKVDGNAKAEQSFAKEVKNAARSSDEALYKMNQKLLKESKAIVANPGVPPELRQMARRNMRIAQDNLVFASLKRKPASINAAAASGSSYDRVNMYRDDRQTLFYTISKDDDVRTPDVVVHLDQKNCNPSSIELDAGKLNKAHCEDQDFAVTSSYRRVGCRMLGFDLSPERQRRPDFHPYLDQNR